MPVTILVADDQRAIRAILRYNLELAGFEVVEAADGDEAWQKLQELRVDLLVTDMNMPRVPGIELCKRMREDSRFNQLPIIMFTAFAVKLPAETAQALRISHFEPKPFSPSRLAAVASELMGAVAS
jgi:CheY-like chemotaxis protein